MQLKKIFCAAFVMLLLVLVSVPNFAHAETSDEKQARLEAELKQIEIEQAQTQRILDSTKQQSASYQRDITILDAKIKQSQLEIQKKNIEIERLGKNIVAKNTRIDHLEARIDKGRETLSQLMRKTNELDSYSMPEILLSDQNLSKMLQDLDSFDSVKQSMSDLFVQIRQDQSDTQSERDQLGKQKNQATDARIAIEAAKRDIEKNQSEKQRLLSLSKGAEKTYAQVLAEKRQKAAEIRAALFALRDSQAIPFGKALEYASFAYDKTSVRPAFLLAILTQESSLGKNVGSCYLTNKDTGAGVSAKSGTVVVKVMKPGRDTEPFMDITKAIGLDPYKTLVSCPQSIGWGGAMGPAQFIPSTWVLFEDRIARALGTAHTNPWNPEDAFIASALYLGDLGASGGSYSAERNAACRYYSGSSCKAGSINSTYGDQVMAKARNIQENMIDLLKGV